MQHTMHRATRIATLLARVAQCMVRLMADRVVASICGALHGKSLRTANHVVRGVADRHAFFLKIVDCVAVCHVVFQDQV